MNTAAAPSADVLPHNEMTGTVVTCSQEGRKLLISPTQDEEDDNSEQENVVRITIK